MLYEYAGTGGMIKNNIKFKVLLNDLQEETTTTSQKDEIYVQLSLLSEILEKKIEHINSKNIKSNTKDHFKLKQDTIVLLKKFQRLKFLKKDHILNDKIFNNMENNSEIESNIFEEENLNNVLEIAFDKDDEINDLWKELHGINKISKETGELMAKHQEILDLIEIEAQKTEENSEKVVKELKVAANETIKKRKNYIKLFFVTLGGLIGIQGGPVGVGVGAVAGGCVGGLTSLSLNPLQNKIKKLDEKK